MTTYRVRLVVEERTQNTQDPWQVVEVTPLTGEVDGPVAQAVAEKVKRLDFSELSEPVNLDALDQDWLRRKPEQPT
jgi:hypothetical protein